MTTWRLMNSGAVLAFCPSAAASLLFLSVPNKELKGASERNRVGAFGWISFRLQILFGFWLLSVSANGRSYNG